jgi:uncharacterized glyoxalase superfamily protein PhnB
MSTTHPFRNSPDNRSMPAVTVIPVLQYPDVQAAAAWLISNFGFTERLRIAAHRTQMSVGEGALVIAMGAASIQTHTVSIMVRVNDVDAHARHAETAGARLISRPETFPYGERQYSVADLCGYIWTFSQSVSDVDPETWNRR